MSRNTINNTPGSQNTQHSATPTSNLRAPSILDNARAESQTHSLRLEQQQLILRLDLQRDLSLATTLPAAQDGRLGLVGDEVFVAGEGSVGSLGGDFTCRAKATRKKSVKFSSFKFQHFR